MVAEQSPGLGHRPLERPPLLCRHEEVRTADLAYPADVVLVEVGDDGGGDVGGVVAEAREAGREGLVLADLEPGEPVVDQPDGTVRADGESATRRGAAWRGRYRHGRCRP